MRKLPYEPYDEEDYKIMQSIIDKGDARYRKNEVYIKTSKDTTIRVYDKPPRVDNGNEQ